MSINVLIVDDDKANCTLIAKTLAPRGFAYATVSSGKAAIEEIAKQNFDVVLLDVMMPGMDGFETCRLIKKNEATRFLPVILVTALHESEDRVKGIESGCDDFLSKPLDRMELIARVKALGDVKKLHDDLENAETVVMSLAKAVAARDDDTGEHCDNIDKLAVQFGKFLELEPSAIKLLERVAILHDVGKIGIPDAILLKPGKLTEDEWKTMRRHPIIGEEICKPLRTLKDACPIIRAHHEKWNGAGYPDGLKGEEIPYLARVFQILDAYDALMRERPYKKAMTQDETMKILQDETNRGLWDPELMKRFTTFINL